MSALVALEAGDRAAAKAALADVAADETASWARARSDLAERMAAAKSTKKKRA